MSVQTMEIKGERYVILPESEYLQMARDAKLPELPERATDGSVPAVEFLRASIARADS